jgi:hypothetical protein
VTENNAQLFVQDNLAGIVSIKTDLGQGLNAKLDFTQATPRVMLDTQLVTAGSIDATLLNTYAVLKPSLTALFSSQFAP